jgi:hypothetical protein
MTKEEIKQGAYPCEVKRWKFNWRGEHSEQVQAAYIKASLQIFIKKPFVIGACYYNWRDEAKCWQCQQTDCPAETAWGLLDQNGKPKESYHMVQHCSQLFEATQQL